MNGAGGPQPARPEDLRTLGLPAALVPDWPGRFAEAFLRLLGRHRSLRTALDNCVRCGVCAGACPVYIETGDPGDSPAALVELARQARWRLVSFTGRPRRFRGPGRTVNDGLLARWFHYFHRCLLCRRCAGACPLGVDPAEVVLAAREVLAETGLGGRGAATLAAAARRTGNSLGLSAEAVRDACLDLEKELFQSTGVAVRAPVDEKGCEVLFLPPAADLAGNRAGLAGCALVFHAAGVSWTVSTRAADAANYGWFLGYRHLKRINRNVFLAVDQLRPRVVVWGETGHGWRVARNFSDTLSGPLAGMATLLTKRPLHICEFTEALLLKGAFKGRLDPAANDGWTVTYHDPCHAARGAGLLDPPRRLLRAAVNRFVEMPGNTIREMTACCGAGAGRLFESDRTIGGNLRARAFAASGADFLATTCDDCRAALPKVLAERPDLPARVGGVLELFGRALRPYLESLGLPETGPGEADDER
ncbi:MAG: (Fe-S)-binding protein [Thermodesulfobacteriota bacterium]